MKLKTFGRPRLELERTAFRDASNEILQKCQIGNHNETTCANLKKGEKQFLDELRERQITKSLEILGRQIKYSTQPINHTL